MESQSLLSQFGSRMRPTEFHELLNTQNEIRDVLRSYSGFPDLLGFPDSDFNQTIQVTFKHQITRDAANLLRSVVVRARRLGLAAVDFEADPG
jgi:hypothetical protein